MSTRGTGSGSGFGGNGPGFGYGCGRIFTPPCGTPPWTTTTFFLTGSEADAVAANASPTTAAATSFLNAFIASSSLCLSPVSLSQGLHPGNPQTDARRPSFPAVGTLPAPDVC